MGIIKREILKAFATAANEKEFEGIDLVLYTPSGIIYGKMVMDGVEIQQTEQEKAVSSVYTGLLNAVHATSGCGDLNDCESYIYLTNASIKTSFAAPSRLGNIVVFCDQITGVSIGTVQHREPNTKPFT